VTGIRQDKRLLVRHPVFRSECPPTESHFPFHSRLVALQKGNAVPLDQKLRDFQFALGGSLKGAPGLREAIEVCVAEGKLEIAESKVRIELDNFPGRFDPLFVLAEDRVNHSRQESVSVHLTRIRLRPGLTGLLRLFQVSRDLHLVGSRDKEFLSITGAIPQLIRLADARRREGGLSNRAIRKPQIRVCHRELGVDFKGALKKRHGGSSAS